MKKLLTTLSLQFVAIRCKMGSMSIVLERRKLSFQLAKRFGWNCWYCGWKLTPGGEFHIDHIIAKSRGGEDNIGNLALTCHFCNHAKMDHELDAFMDWIEYLRSGQSYTPFNMDKQSIYEVCLEKATASGKTLPPLPEEV